MEFVAFLTNRVLCQTIVESILEFFLFYNCWKALWKTVVIFYKFKYNVDKGSDLFNDFFRNAIEVECHNNQLKDEGHRRIGGAFEDYIGNKGKLYKKKKESQTYIIPKLASSFESVSSSSLSSSSSLAGSTTN